MLTGAGFTRTPGYIFERKAKPTKFLISRTDQKEKMLC